MAVYSLPEFSPINYTAIGDSLTVGKGSGLFSSGYVERFSGELSERIGKPVFPHKFARVGAKSEEILSYTYTPPITHLLENSSFITITSGGNDLIDGGKQFLQTRDPRVIQQAIQTALYNNHRIVEHLNELYRARSVNGRIFIFNMYNPLPQIPEADEGIQAYNNALGRLDYYRHVKVVDLYQVFKAHLPYLLSRDGIHPNSEGYAVMAHALLNS